jgi:(p)ppGpp synthase/HD superfamily hydrolase
MSTYSRDLSAEFDSWYKGILPELQKLDGRLGERFQDSLMVDHDRRLAGLFLEMGDLDLARAAALHGVSDHAFVHRTLGGREAVSVRILDACGRLRALDHTDPELPSRLSQNVLPALGDLRGAVLMLFETFDRLDPGRELARFSAASHLGGSELPALNRTRLPHWKSDIARESAFIAAVGAATAQFFDLWPERNYSEDLALYYQDRDRMEQLIRFKALPDVAVEIDKRIEAIRNVLDGVEDLEVVWEWHHYASLVRKLAGLDEKHYTHRLSACGMASVICSTVEGCYTVLGRLHRCFEHQSLDIQDTIGRQLVPRSQPAGISRYEAIHTLITVPGTEKYVRVRILTDESQRRRHTWLDRQRLQVIRDQFYVPKQKVIRVFAFDGRLFLLPLGSTVLNFCNALYRRSVAFATGALVNRVEVSLLHKLQDGDVVRIQLGDRPRELPSGWEKNVPPATVSGLRREFKRYFRPQRVQAGRSILKALVGAKTDISGLDDYSFDSYVEEHLLSDASLPRDIITLFKKCSEEENQDLVRTWAERIGGHISQAQRVDLDMLTVPKELMHTFTDIQVCSHCSPRTGENVVGNVDQNGVLLIHSGKLRRCVGEGAQPLVWQRDSFRGQYFVIEMANRQGIASEILGVLSHRSIDLISHAGTTLATSGPGWAVLRLHVRSLLRNQIRQVIEELGAIPGVLRVLPPHAEPLPALEANLPPREITRTLSPRIGSPYVAGPIITDPDYFYGRHSELAQLRNELDRVAGGKSFVFVKGPYRIGKTSLVYQFFNECRRPEFACADVTITVQREVSWGTVQHELRRRVEEVVGRYAPGSRSKTSGVPLAELVAAVPQLIRRKFLVFIDEIVGLLKASEEVGEGGEVVDFLSKISVVSDLMLIVAGPEAPSNDLPSRSRGFLATGQSLHVGILNESEVRSLLSAEKLKHRGVRISVADRVSQRVFRFTGGNPYWCNILAQGAIRNAKSTVLTEEHIENGQHHLAGASYAFQDRIIDPMPSHPGVGKGIIHFLANNRRGASADRLLEEFGQLSPGDLRTLLERLHMRGAIRLRNGRWHIDCPALAEHIVNYQGRVTSA